MYPTRLILFLRRKSHAFQGSLAHPDIKILHDLNKGVLFLPKRGEITAFFYQHGAGMGVRSCNQAYVSLQDLISYFETPKHQLKLKGS
jgi:hypothetical protein